MSNVIETPYKNYLFFLKNFLSNFHACRFYDENLVPFSNTEQYFMYHKALTFGDKDVAAAILTTDNPFEAKALGRQVRGYSDKVWNEVRYKIFRDANMLKYSQNKDLAGKLLATGNLILIECNESDHIWSCGLTIEKAKKTPISEWPGKNMLGYLLMDVRHELSKQ